MTTSTKHPNPTVETCSAQSQEFRADFAASLKKLHTYLEKSSKKFRADLAKSSKEHNHRMAELDRWMKETAEESKRETEEIKRIQKENSRMIGGMSNSNGEVAESYFINSFEKKPYFAGQDYEHFSSNLRKKSKRLNLQGEYDLVMYNCTSIAIIEIKYKAEADDVAPLLRKAQTFKQLFPEYTNYDLYLGLAGLHVDANAEKEAKEQGIAIIKQVGDAMVIYDADLRVF